jgi:hypothetical protein
VLSTVAVLLFLPAAAGAAPSGYIPIDRAEYLKFPKVPRYRGFLPELMVQYLQVPRIEVSQSGQTFTYETTDCDSVYRFPLFEPKEIPRSQLDSDCERKLKTSDFTFLQYGGGAVHFRFSKDFRDQPPSMNYVYTATIVFQTNAYLSRGSCAKVN